MHIQLTGAIIRRKKAHTHVCKHTHIHSYMLYKGVRQPGDRREEGRRRTRGGEGGRELEEDQIFKKEREKTGRGKEEERRKRGSGVSHVRRRRRGRGQVVYIYEEEKRDGEEREWEERM